MSDPGEPSCAVLIAGRGPVGMTAALRLARFGVASVLVDELDAVPGPGSKALCMAREAIQILDQVGCGEPLARDGIYWRLGRTFFEGSQVASIHLEDGGPARFPAFVNYPQQDTERLLIDRVAAEPLITTRYRTRLTALEQDGERVRCRLTGPDGGCGVSARYVIGADGARSTVRAQVGIPFSGRSYAVHFMVCDVRLTRPRPTERHLHFSPPYNPGRTALIHPVPDSVCHIDWQVGPEPVDLDAELAAGVVDRRIRSVLGEVPYELVWLSTYSFRSLRAERFRAGRVFLAGDAAHLFSPYGARGLNSGLSDADNLAWRLGLVLTGRAPASLLAGYAPEREQAAAENLRVTDATARFMAPPDDAAQHRRDDVLRRALSDPAAADEVDAGHFYQPAVYPSALGPRPLGTLVPDAELARPDGGRCWLRSLVGAGFLAVGIGAVGIGAAGIGAVGLVDDPGQAPDLPVLRVITVGDSPGDLRDLHDALAGFRPAAGAAGWLLVRPDGYLADVWTTAAGEPPGLDARLRRFLAAGPPGPAPTAPHPSPAGAPGGVDQEVSP